MMAIYEDPATDEKTHHQTGNQFGERPRASWDRRGITIYLAKQLQGITARSVYSIEDRQQAIDTCLFKFCTSDILYTVAYNVKGTFTSTSPISLRM